MGTLTSLTLGQYEILATRSYVDPIAAADARPSVGLDGRTGLGTELLFSVPGRPPFGSP